MQNVFIKLILFVEPSVFKSLLNTIEFSIFTSIYNTLYNTITVKISNKQIRHVTFFFKYLHQDSSNTLFSYKSHIYLNAQTTQRTRINKTNAPHGPQIKTTPNTFNSKTLSPNFPQPPPKSKTTQNGISTYILPKTCNLEYGPTQDAPWSDALCI